MWIEARSVVRRPAAVHKMSLSSRPTPVPRGLTVFIADLRNCNIQTIREPESLRVHVLTAAFSGRAKEQEEKRVNKELANIRSKFKGRFSFNSFLMHGFS